MIISTDLLYQAYPTLVPDSDGYLVATNRTCNLLNPDQDAGCDACLIYSGNPIPGYGCALYLVDNPDLDESWALFYEAYPEYLI